MLPVFQLSTGPVPLLAFHGVGQSHRHFEPLARAVEGRYALYAFDLFFHGDQPITIGEDDLTKAAWAALLASFLEQHRMERFAVVGFSMGGKFALATVEAFPERIEELLLIAPDGIKLNFWYKAATGTALGRLLFRFTLRHIPLLQRLGTFLLSLRLLDRSVLRFAETMLTTPEKRAQVYHTWVAFRHLRFNLVRLSRLLNQHGIRVQFFLGYFDRVVPLSVVMPLTSRLKTYQLTALRTGHHRMIEKVADVLARQTP